MGKKWTPCFCTAILGVLVVLFTWWTVSWGQIALTVLGALIVIRGLVGECCCSGDKKGSSCCS
ncbi:MAG: hypothetical protein HN337_07045 [Deltaproteobacteria bacterium]|jgi:hypothetical protein|nr:hypothetical protein [Deltaproteobacteria bacterium]